MFFDYKKHTLHSALNSEVNRGELTHSDVSPPSYFYDTDIPRTSNTIYLLRNVPKSTDRLVCLPIHLYSTILFIKVEERIRL